MTLIERHGQLASLDQLYANCVRGRGGVAVISGPVASGKTALLHTFARRVVDAGARYVNANASRIERMQPLGVVSQLFRAAGLSGEPAEQVNALLDDAALAATLHEGEPENAEQAMAPRLRGLGLALLGLADDGPLVIGVDDVHYADVPSLLCLSYLARRVGSAPVLMIVNECTLPQPAQPLLYGELLRQPNCHQIRLGPLGKEGVTTLAGERLGQPRASQMAGTLHAMTGGNLLLTHALIDDLLTGGQADSATAAAGKAFSHAVVAFLHRCESTVLRVARGLAVLDQPAPPALLGRLLDLPADMAARSAEELDRSGVIESGRFRHPRVPAAVLIDMDVEERTALHERAARLLRQDGATATAVARHLIAADRLDTPWAVALLREAADQALADGDTERALSYLRAAFRACRDEDQRLEIKSALARAEWRVDPFTARRYLDDLIKAVRERRLSDSHAVTLAQALLWYGRTCEAIEIMRDLYDADALGLEAELGLSDTRVWLSYAFPTQSARLPQHDGGPPAGGLAHATISSSRQAATTLWSVLQDGGGDEATAMAEQVLQRTRLDDTTLGTITAALTALLFADRLDTAELWCDRVAEQAALLRAPTWRALLMAIRAEISFRKGCLPDAERQARAALTLIPPKAWGVAIGAPLGTLLRAATAMGNYRTATDHLSIPVLAEMFETPLAVHYLQGRGRFYLATGRFQTALADFTACGELLAKWQLDLPALSLWRVAAAQAHLRLDECQRARSLLKEQLEQLRPGHLRARGITLRVLAMASPVDQRPGMLNEAVTALKAAGDRLELAHAFADLGQALQALGEFKRAQAVSRTAQQIAEHCQAHALLRSVAPMTGADSGRTAQEGPDDQPAAKLSDAERRVAALAALGHSNREIAAKLYVTVSTVEQHLTRVYRKLRVNNRGDLLSALNLDVASSA